MEEDTFFIYDFSFEIDFSITNPLHEPLQSTIEVNEIEHLEAINLLYITHRVIEMHRGPVFHSSMAFFSSGFLSAGIGREHRCAALVDRLLMLPYSLGNI